jgi:hypothetical protein
MPKVYAGINSQDVHSTIKLLINQLVNIKDETGEFLLRLDDGRVIDTKGMLFSENYCPFRTPSKTATKDYSRCTNGLFGVFAALLCSVDIRQEVY